MIFNSYSNSALQLANRVVMAPMTRCRADRADAVPDELVTDTPDSARAST